MGTAHNPLWRTVPTRRKVRCRTNWAVFYFHPQEVKTYAGRLGRDVSPDLGALLE